MKELYLRCALIDIPDVGDEMWDSFYDWCIHNHTYGNSDRELLVGFGKVEDFAMASTSA